MNKVIKVLTKEHGKKVIDWWKNQGVDTRDLRGEITEENDCMCIYYGVIKAVFNNYDYKTVLENNATIITLDEYPKLMYVRNDECDKFVKRVVFMEKNGKYLAWAYAESLEEANQAMGTATWSYAKDIEEEKEQIVELTIEDISNGKGVGIKPELIRIKK